LKFTEFDLHDEILLGLQDMGFEESTPIQQQAIPLILKGHDLIACAQTGTGKTAAFLIPMIDVLDDIPGAHIKGLILCPTRELAIQIDEACEGLAYHSYVRSSAVFGGNKGGDDFSRQKAAFQQGSDIVIATPGRLLQHISLGYVDLSKLEFLVLDEADRMLDMGFIADIRRIISFCNPQRQTLLFSATMPPKIRELAQEILHNPTQISIAISKPAEGISQRAYCTHDTQKIPLLQHLIRSTNIESVIIFASRKQSVDRITKALVDLGFDARGMHSDREQIERETIINDFKNKQFPILVATDIMSRGIDIDLLSHVVNFDVPSDPEDYVHRIGRTARNETTGEAITFINEEDMARFGRIERMIEREIEKFPLPEGMGEGPEYNPNRRFGQGGGRGRGGQDRRGGNNRNKGRGPSPQREGESNGPRNGRPQHQQGGQPRPQGPPAQGQGPLPEGQGNRKKKKKKKKRSGEGAPQPGNRGEFVEKQPPRVFLESSDDVGLPTKKSKNNRKRGKGGKSTGPVSPAYIAPGE
jgi:superfamily II DNA/RNA helicase